MNQLGALTQEEPVQDPAAAAAQEAAGATPPLVQEAPPGEEQFLVLTDLLSGWLDPLTTHPWAQAGIVFGAFLVLAKVVELLFRGFFRLATRKSQGEEKQQDERLLKLLRGPVQVTVMLIGIGVALRLVGIPAELARLSSRLLLTIGLLVWAGAAFRSVGMMLRAAANNPNRFKAIQQPTFPLFNNLARIALFLALLYMVTVVWGWDATGWLASAGVAGLVIGFAAQDTLANLFAGVFILGDRPYQVGDMISLDTGERGRVTLIGLRSTRLMTRDDVEVTIPNAVMGGAKIVNESGGMRTRARYKVPFGVAYGSDIDQVMTEVDALAAELDPKRVAKYPKPRSRFTAFGASSLDFELLVWCDDPADRGEVVNLALQAIYKRFAELDIEIPYAKQDLYIKEWPATPSKDG
ncbi:MAG: mechanosensitive ion channel family protein [Planctomycetota bacterium]